MKQAILAICAVIAVFALLLIKNKEAEIISDDQKIELEFWSYGTGGPRNPAGAFWERMGKKFEELHPEVDMKIVADIPHGTYLSILSTRFIGGKTPDILILDDGNVGDLAQEGLLKQLDEYVYNDPAYHPEDFPPSMLADGIVNGKRYSIPWYGGFGCIFYRTDLLKKAGVEPPDTWDELIEVCRALQDKVGLKYPFGYSVKGSFFMMPWIWQNGGDIMSEDERTVEVDSPEAIGAVQFVHDLMYKYQVMDPSLATGSYPYDLWGMGKLALLLDGSWNIGRYDDLYPQWKGKWDVAVVPGNKYRYSFFGGQVLVMNKRTKHPDLAWEFMQMSSLPRNQRLFSELTGYPPGNRKVLEMPDFRKEHPRLTITEKVMPLGRNSPLAPFIEKIWYQYFESDVIDEVMPRPNADVAAAVKKTAKTMQRIVDEYWKIHEYYVQGGPKQ